MKNIVATLIITIFMSVQAQEVCDKGGAGVSTLWEMQQKDIRSSVLVSPPLKATGFKIASPIVSSVPDWKFLEDKSIAWVTDYTSPSFPAEPFVEVLTSILASENGTSFWVRKQLSLRNSNLEGEGELKAYLVILLEELDLKASLVYLCEYGWPNSLKMMLVQAGDTFVLATFVPDLYIPNQIYLDAVVAPVLEFDAVLNERVIPYTEQRLMYY